MAKTEVATVQNTAVSEISNETWESMAGKGNEAADVNDFAIPYLIVLQKLSPQLDSMPDAKAGYVLETATNRLFNTAGEGVEVIPCYFRKDMVEWKPRESGGGLVKAHGWNQALMETTTRNDRGQMILPNGNVLVDTKYHYVLIVTPEGVMHAVISMTSTQLKKSRKWLTMMQMNTMTRADGTKFQAPSFAFSYVLKTIKEENEKGSWNGWTIEQGPPVTNREMVQAAMKFYRSIQAGEVKISDPDAAFKEDLEAPF